jgi:hypothetical protein
LDEVPTTVKIIQDLKCLIIGYKNGNLKIYKWSFKPNLFNLSDTLTLDSDLDNQILSSINLHSESLDNFILTKNNKHIITSSSDGSIYLCRLMVSQKGKIEIFDYFNKNGGKLKPKTEELLKMCDIHDFILGDITKKDEKANTLLQNINALKLHFQSKKDMIFQEYLCEFKNLEEQVNIKFIYINIY